MILHRIIVLLIETETSIHSGCGLAVTGLLHHPTCYHVFLGFERVHIHRFRHVALMFPSRMLSLLSLDPVSPTLHCY